MYIENIRDIGLCFHHVGLLVESIDDSIINYSKLFGEFNVSKITRINSQKVRVCFIKIASSHFIELVEPTEKDSPVYNLLKKRISYYHIGYKVANIDLAVSILEGLNFKKQEYFYSEAFEGRRCMFLFSPDTHLIELIEEKECLTKI